MKIRRALEYFDKRRDGGNCDEILGGMFDIISQNDCRERN